MADRFRTDSRIKGKNLTVRIYDDAPVAEVIVKVDAARQERKGYVSIYVNIRGERCDYLGAGMPFNKSAGIPKKEVLKYVRKYVKILERELPNRLRYCPPREMRKGPSD